MSLAQHLPALLVITPLLAAPLALLTQQAWLARLIAFLATGASFTAALAMLSGHFAHGHEPWTYHMGNWPVPMGIAYHLDALGLGIVTLVGFIATLSLCLTGKAENTHKPAFYAAWLLLTAGLQGMTATHDAFNFYVFLEIASLASYTLIAQGRDKRALTASFHYLIMGTLGATFFLIGLGLLYIQTGTLNMTDISVRLAEIPASPSIRVGAALILTGLALKSALFPLHLWLPNAYAFAPHSVTTFMSATATKVGLYALLRFSADVLNLPLLWDGWATGELLLIFSTLAIFYAGFQAAREPLVKKLLAWSTISQIGLITLAFSTGTETGIAAGTLHIFNHAIAKAALFAALACFACALADKPLTIKNLQGLGKALPVPAFAFLVGGLAMIGIPLTNGFISKWQIFLAIAPNSAALLALILGSLLTAWYIWRSVEPLYQGTKPTLSRVPLTLQIPALMLALLTLATGLFPQPLITLAQESARQLLENASQSVAMLELQTTRIWP